MLLLPMQAPVGFAAAAAHLLWLLCYAGAASALRVSDNHRAAGTAAAVNGYTTLLNTINMANLEGFPISMTLTQDVILESPFPVLVARSGIGIKGACKDTLGRPRRCVIDGARKHHMFPGSGYIGSCSITLENLIVQNMFNGVHFGGCKFTATNVLFQNNFKALGGGGAVLSAGRLYPYAAASPNRFTNCTFLNNTVGTYSGSGGGAITSGHNGDGTPDLEIINCNFQQNSARSDEGGAIEFEGNSTLTVVGSTFKGNVAGTNGGAIAFSGYRLSVTRTSFLNNVAGEAKGTGGALFLDAFNTHTPPVRVSDAVFCGSTFVGNVHSKAPNIFLMDQRGFSFGVLTFCGMATPGGIVQNPVIRRNLTWSFGTTCTTTC